MEEKISFKLELTMSDLLNAALGHQQLTPDNFKILRLFIDILLEKLNCGDEQVTIEGATALCLEQLRRTAQMPAIPANTQGVLKFADKYKQMDKFDADLTALEARYAQHMHDIREYNRVQDEKFQCVNWEMYSSPCDNLCVMPEPEDKIACDLIQNADFIYRLRKRLTFPMQRRLERCSKELDECQAALHDVMAYVEEEREKFALLDVAVIRIEKLRGVIALDYKQFYEAVEEIQAMLDAKLDKVHMPALKLYVKITTKNIHTMLKDFYRTTDCKRADQQRIVGSATCLSCGCNSCIRQCIEFKFPPRYGSYCGCTGVCLNTGSARTLMDFIKKLNLDEYIENVRTQGEVLKHKSPMNVTSTPASVVRFT